MAGQRELHYRYWVGILLATIVALIALSFYGQQELVEKFDFAATLSSLLLALVAIVYSVASALKQEIQLSRLTETNIDIRSTAIELRSLAGDISNFAKDAPRQFESISNKIDTVKNGFTTLNRAPEVVTEEGDSAQDISVDRFRRIFFEMQIGAMVALYFFWRSQRKSKPFSWDDYKNGADGSFEYAMGVFTMLEAIGLIRFSYHKQEVIPLDVSGVVAENIVGLISTITADASDDFGKSLAARIGIVDAHFDSPPSPAVESKAAE